MPSRKGTASSAGAVADALREMGALIALDPANRFKARAYETAARAVAVLPDLAARVDAGTLMGIPGIGRSIARTIEQLVRTGRADALDRLRERHPPGAAELSRVLSPSRLRAVHEALGVTTLVDLRAACAAGRLRGIPGFGEKTEHRLLARIDELAARRPAVTLALAEQLGLELSARLREHPAVQAVELAGAFRRRIEVIERLDLVVAADDVAAVVDHAGRVAGDSSLTPAGDDEFVVQRHDEPDAHVRVVPPRSFSVAWAHATGPPAHTERLTSIARDAGLTLDDRTLRKAGRPVPVDSEAALYERLGLAWVPPELRDDGTELEAAASGGLPDDLLRLEDLQGVVHCHTVHSDGKHTVEEMARAADAVGLRYLTITDHSTSAHYARGLDVARLRRQWDEIARVQERVSVRLLRGTESDILRDGSLDFPDAVLEQLDVVIASIHERHGMDADQMTRRLVRAMRHPVFKIWGHALGRYVLSRPPFACRLDEVLDAVAESRAAVEVNGDPHRLDLPPEHLRAASRRGIRFVVSADAHSTTALRNLRWGVDMARRGWLRRHEVLNTLGPDEFAAAVRP